jgi:hypothetical protein
MVGEMLCLQELPEGQGRATALPRHDQPRRPLRDTRDAMEAPCGARPPGWRLLPAERPRAVPLYAYVRREALLSSQIEGTEPL